METKSRGKNIRSTSWQGVSKWYGSIVGEKGHYYHQAVVIPNCLRLLNLKQGDKLLDIACGQGVFSRNIPGTIVYTGVDAAKSLIDEARRMDKNSIHKYFVTDVTKEVTIREKYTKAVMILALQNIKEPEKAVKYAADRLDKDGRFLVVINHPCFRIPRQSSWETDKTNKMQYRRINRYMTPLEIPINAHPGEQGSPVTWSFHHPLEDYVRYLSESGFLVEKLEEWTSDKKSDGSAAKMENRAREEFPMFMAILAVKK